MPRSRRALQLTSICSVVLVLAGAAAWHAHGHRRVGELPWVDVSIGPVAFPAPTIHTYRSNLALRRYVVVADPGRTIPAVDFGGGRFEAILVTLGPRSSSGYSIDVRSVEEQRNRIVVRARQRAPRLGEPVRPFVTYPYRLLRVPAREKPATVVWEDA